MAAKVYADPNPASPAVEESVTLGIVTFNRPDVLARLIQSVREHYPALKIIIADNGELRADVASFDGVTYLELPIDCGLSASRNRIIEALATPYLLIVDDDFEFTGQTVIEHFVEVLHHDPQVGVVGGPLIYPDGRQLDFACDLDWFRDAVYLRPSCGRWCATPSGVAYRIVDVVLNFALFRREMLEDHRWDERLKLHEHEDYFLSVKQARQWRVAFCDLVKCNHVQQHTAAYARYRNRERTFMPIVRAKWGIRDYDPEPEVLVGDGLHAVDAPPPNVLLVGNGAAEAARLMSAAGWRKTNEALARFNQHVLETGLFDAAEADRLLRTQHKPWILEDPRFVYTLDQWMSPLARQSPQPVLAWAEATSDTPAIGVAGVPAAVFDQLTARTYRRWPWHKVQLPARRLQEVVQTVADPASSEA